jgi:hypothetical protein
MPNDTRPRTRRIDMSELPTRSEWKSRIARTILVTERPAGDWVVDVSNADGIVTTTRHDTEGGAHLHALETYLEAVACVGSNARG